MSIGTIHIDENTALEVFYRPPKMPATKSVVVLGIVLSTLGLLASGLGILGLTGIPVGTIGAFFSNGLGIVMGPISLIALIFFGFIGALFLYPFVSSRLSTDKEVKKEENSEILEFLNQDEGKKDFIDPALDKLQSLDEAFVVRPGHKGLWRHYVMIKDSSGIRIEVYDEVPIESRFSWRVRRLRAKHYREFTAYGRGTLHPTQDPDGKGLKEHTSQCALLDHTKLGAFFDYLLPLFPA